MSRAYITTRRLHDLEAALSPRDREVLATLKRLRMASGAQLGRLHFSDVSARQARLSLASLVDRGLVARLPRQVGGVRAGSAGYVYCLDIAGQKIMEPGKRRTTKPWEVSPQFVAHALAVSGLYVDLVDSQRAGRLQLAVFETEPRCWRRFVGVGGGRVSLKPDASVTVILDRFEDRWFVEVDNATESGTAILKKCDQYLRYWRSGAEQGEGEVFPRILWTVPNERRHARIVNLLGQLPGDTWRLFAVALHENAADRITQGAHV